MLKRGLFKNVNDFREEGIGDFKAETSQPRRAHLTRVSNLRLDSGDVPRRLVQTLR